MARSSRMLLVLFFALLTAGPVAGASGQDAKVPLTHDVYDGWRSIRGPTAPEWMTRGIRGWEKGEADR